MKTAPEPATDFNLSARMMFAAMRIAESGEHFRRYLSGALIEPIDGGGVWIVATDGTGMLVQRDRAGFAPCRAILSISKPAEPPLNLDEGDIRPLWQETRISVPQSVLHTPQVGHSFWKDAGEPIELMVCESVGDPDAVAILCAKSVDADEDTSLAILLTDIGATKLRDDLGLAAPTPEAAA